MERAHPRVPRPRSEADDLDQVVVLRGIPWAQYDGLCRARESAGGTRISYLDGVLEIVSVSQRHELYKKLLARLVEAYAEETELELNGTGNATFRKKAKEAGVEPDESYSVGKVKSPPEMVIELVLTSGGVDKLEIYRRLGVGEVWFWIAEKIHVYRLVGDHFVRRARSEVIPDIDLDELQRIVTSASDARQTQTVRAYRRMLQKRRG